MEEWMKRKDGQKDIVQNTKDPKANTKTDVNRNGLRPLELNVLA